MLRKIIALLDPSATDGGGAETAPDFLGAFINDDPPAATATADPPPANKEPKPDGKTADPGTGTGAGAVAKPVEPAATDPGAKPAAEKPVEPAKTKAEDGDDEKWPRNTEDWDKFKAKRKANEEKLRGEIATRETKLADLQRQLETATKTKPADDTATKAEIERRDALIKSLTDRIAVLDVTKDPRFEEYFDKKTKTQQAMAANILGADKGTELAKILALPEGDYRNERMEAFMGDLTPMQSTRIGGVLNALDGIEQERKAEIEKAGANRETLLAERANRQKAQGEARQKGFETTLTELQDATKGNPLFHKREGDETWNAGLAKRIETAKALLFGGNIAPEQAAKAALFASSLPAVLEAYDADTKAKDAQIATLQAQVKALTAAQPGGGTPAEKGASSAAESPSKIKEGMDPFAIADAFARGLTEHANQ